MGTLWSTIKAELAGIEWKWRPTVIVAWTLFALLIPHYHPQGQWLWRPASSLFSDDTLRYSKMIWLGPQFVLEVVGSLVVIAVVLREPLRSYGLGLGDVRAGLKISAVLAALFVPLFVILYASDGFQSYYGHATKNVTSWEHFLLWKMPAFFFFMVMTELFFRGFLMFGIKKHYGTYAGVLASQLAFVAWHFDKPEIEAFGSFPVGLGLAYLANRTGSIWYGVILHAGFAALGEALLVARALS